MKKMDLKTVIQKAEEGDIDSMIRVVHYFVFEDENNGHYDPQVKSKVLDYILKAVEKRDEGALLLLGRMYYEGRVVRRSYKKALELFTQAADEGSIAAIYHLGICNLEGKGTKVNQEKAFEYFTKASVLGNLAARASIGDMYMNGQYVEKDERVAISIYIKVMKAIGEVDSYDDQILFSDMSLHLARAFMKGIGGLEYNPNSAQHFYSDALNWYLKRTKRGDQAAIEEYPKILNEFTEALDKMRDGWKPSH